MYLTDNELLNRYAFYVSSIEEQLVLRGSDDIEDMLDQIPLITVLSRPGDVKLTHTNKLHEKLTGYSPEDVRGDTSRYLQDIVHPESLRNVKSFLPEFYSTSRTGQTMSFIQYVRLQGAKEFNPLITFTKAPRIINAPVARISAEPGEMSKTWRKVERIIEMDQFKLQHFDQYHQLTEREIQLLKLLATGYNNPAIADKLSISRNTVETHRKHLKAKLGLNSYSDLMRWAMAFDLVEL